MRVLLQWKHVHKVEEKPLELVLEGFLRRPVLELVHGVALELSLPGVPVEESFNRDLYHLVTGAVDDIRSVLSLSLLRRRPLHQVWRPQHLPPDVWHDKRIAPLPVLLEILESLLGSKKFRRHLANTGSQNLLGCRCLLEDLALALFVRFQHRGKQLRFNRSDAFLREVVQSLELEPLSAEGFPVLSRFAGATEVLLRLFPKFRVPRVLVRHAPHLDAALRAQVVTALVARSQGIDDGGVALAAQDSVPVVLQALQLLHGHLAPPHDSLHPQLVQLVLQDRSDKVLLADQVLPRVAQERLLRLRLARGHRAHVLRHLVAPLVHPQRVLAVADSHAPWALVPALLDGQARVAPLQTLRAVVKPAASSAASHELLPPLAVVAADSGDLLDEEGVARLPASPVRREGPFRFHCHVAAAAAALVLPLGALLHSPRAALVVLLLLLRQRSAPSSPLPPEFHAVAMQLPLHGREESDPTLAKLPLRGLLLAQRLVRRRQFRRKVDALELPRAVVFVRHLLLLLLVLVFFLWGHKLPGRLGLLLPGHHLPVVDAGAVVVDRERAAAAVVRPPRALRVRGGGIRGRRSLLLCDAGDRVVLRFRRKLPGHPLLCYLGRLPLPRPPHIKGRCHRHTVLIHVRGVGGNRAIQQRCASTSIWSSRATLPVSLLCDERTRPFRLRSSCIIITCCINFDCIITCLLFLPLVLVLLLLLPFQYDNTWRVRVVFEVFEYLRVPLHRITAASCSFLCQYRHTVSLGGEKEKIREASGVLRSYLSSLLSPLSFLLFLY
mmetsp:Transcript_2595/g.4251  ORF Transcript_2595/g.4251 Transcript_2595/m.4251 type:complete len:780 (-) Transcript_2595:23-2362(-)